MQPIVHGIQKQYKACLKVERVYFLSETDWHRLIGPVGTPEFALVDRDQNILRRWAGLTEKFEFEEVIAPLCG